MNSSENLQGSNILSLGSLPKRLPPDLLLLPLLHHHLLSPLHHGFRNPYLLKNHLLDLGLLHYRWPRRGGPGPSLILRGRQDHGLELGPVSLQGLDPEAEGGDLAEEGLALGAPPGLLPKPALLFPEPPLLLPKPSLLLPLPGGRGGR